MSPYGRGARVSLEKIIRAKCFKGDRFAEVTIRYYETNKRFVCSCMISERDSAKSTVSSWGGDTATFLEQWKPAYDKVLKMVSRKALLFALIYFAHGAERSLLATLVPMAWTAADIEEDFNAASS